MNIFAVYYSINFIGTIKIGTKKHYVDTFQKDKDVTDLFDELHFA